MEAPRGNGYTPVMMMMMTDMNALQVLFDAASCIKRYTNVTDILNEFYELRLKYYVKRKEYMEGMLSAESLKLANQARFICEKIEGRIAIGNLSLYSGYCIIVGLY